MYTERQRPGTAIAETRQPASSAHMPEKPIDSLLLPIGFNMATGIPPVHGDSYRRKHTSNEYR